MNATLDRKTARNESLVECHGQLFKRFKMLDVLDRIQDPRSVIIIHVGVRRSLLGLLLGGSVGLRTTLVGRCLELVLGWD